MGEKVGKTVKAQMTTRALTKLEKRSMKNYNRTKKYEENYLQIGTEVSLTFYCSFSLLSVHSKVEYNG